VDAGEGKGGIALSGSARSPDGDVKKGRNVVKATVAERPVEVNERGFMVDLSEWSPEAAEYLARHQGRLSELDGLTPDHWRVIDYMRARYYGAGTMPSLREICTNLVLTKRRFFELFPGGLILARRISGLPGPRRSANGSALSSAQQVLTGNWWVRLTR
jgi:TusE/DsrC/DsvC family sulfur relay protein